MDIRKINDAFSVCPQIEARDVQAIAAMGFKSILCNRPDGEGSDQPSFATLRDAAVRAGLEAAYVPVAPSGPGPKEAAGFARAFNALPKPVLAFCRSGNRSLATWTAGVAAGARG